METWETVKTAALLNETLIIRQLASGLTVYAVPKKRYAKRQALLCVRYGSADGSFAADGLRRDTPEGTAHFLEHKLFEEPDGGNAFSRFAALGVACNAFTTLNLTGYGFVCADGERFEESLSLLLSFTRQPYFTADNIEKERGIIEREIDLYADDPRQAVHLNLLRALYHTHPARHPIAGTADSIRAVTAELLYDCYDAFYQPANMALIVAGDTDIDRVCALAETIVAAPPAAAPPVRLYGDEPKTAAQTVIQATMGVSPPLFQLGFKETALDGGFSPAKKNAAAKVLLDSIAGDSGDFYAEMVQKGLIDDSFGANYISGPSFGVSLFGGFSVSPATVRDCLAQAIRKLRQDGIPDALFDRIKKKHMGSFIRGFNALDAIVFGQADAFAKGTDLIELWKGYHHLTKGDIMEWLCTQLNEETAMALSVID